MEEFGEAHESFTSKEVQKKKKITVYAKEKNLLKKRVVACS